MIKLGVLQAGAFAWGGLAVAGAALGISGFVVAAALIVGLVTQFVCWGVVHVNPAGS